MNKLTVFTTAVLFMLVLAASAIFAPVQAKPAFPLQNNKLDLEISLQVVSAAVRTWSWNVSVSASPATWDLFRGDMGTAQFTASLARTGYTDAFQVSGQATIRNPDLRRPAVLRKVEGSFGNQVVPLDCEVRLPHILKPGQTLTCSYSFAAPDGAWRSLHVRVETVGAVGSAAASTQVTFAAPQEVNASVRLQSDQGSQWTFSNSGSVSFEKIYTCDADQGLRSTSVSLLETGQQVSAQVQINCHQLEVTLAAQGLFQRIYFWDLEKTANLAELELQVGETALVNYTIDTRMSHFIDWQYRFKVFVTVRNPSAFPTRQVQIYSNLEDSDQEPACSQISADSLAPGERLTCLYYPGTPDASPRQIWAVGVLDNFLYAPDGSIISMLGTTGFYQNITAEYGEPSDQVYTCGNVLDSQIGSLGEVCVSTAPKTFSYSLQVGPYPACGQYQVVNTARIDIGWTESVWTLNVNVPCEP